MEDMPIRVRPRAFLLGGSVKYTIEDCILEVEAEDIEADSALHAVELYIRDLERFTYKDGTFLVTSEDGVQEIFRVNITRLARFGVTPKGGAETAIVIPCIEA